MSALGLNPTNAVDEYVALCNQIVSADMAGGDRLYGRLDQLWYSEMSAADQEEAEVRLAAADTDMLAELRMVDEGCPNIEPV